MSDAKKVIKRGRVRLEEPAGGSPGRAVRAAPGAARTPQPRARLVRIDGRVSAIEFTCRCGEVTLLEIEHDDAARPAEEET